jgi:hypothetical protein
MYTEQQRAGILYRLLVNSTEADSVVVRNFCNEHLAMIVGANNEDERTRAYAKLEQYFIKFNSFLQDFVTAWSEKQKEQTAATTSRNLGEWIPLSETTSPPPMSRPVLAYDAQQQRMMPAIKRNPFADLVPFYEIDRHIPDRKFTHWLPYPAPPRIEQQPDR